MFEPGDIVECIRSGGLSSLLKVGSLYEIDEVFLDAYGGDGAVTLKGKFGHKCLIDRFKPVNQ